MKQAGLNQSVALPEGPRPIVIVGAGGIVRDAHLPAYAKAGFAVVGIYDLDEAKARALACDFKISRVYSSLQQAVREAPPTRSLTSPCPPPRSSAYCASCAQAPSC